MNPALGWIMEHLFGTDWMTMNRSFGDFVLNVPLMIFFSVLLTLIANCVIWIISSIICTSNWRLGYDTGYTDGMHTKACKLSKIKFNHDDNVILVVTERSEVEQEKQEALKRH